MTEVWREKRIGSEGRYKAPPLCGMQVSMYSVLRLRSEKMRDAGVYKVRIYVECLLQQAGRYQIEKESGKYSGGGFDGSAVHRMRPE